ncbi:hypothetical protein Fleli_3944 [Bernardetia litoralis DSM 6794]|uniref:Secretion system C-terminal sorting domain-containing protein n=1 Tax=Bernardetia litoralis (strain ATCC 23117 / DSM 6794 / NBRC 15988 / NCIMB 1366 / Fx l1 / Sio-4) TaxID=880071 RepID=I4AQL1_BERLS|nr:T9SS type A sorting domain-containing protein [Bernardetia litoralis]AFM06246.1 hypothetical protein Fleli_3944 [Bernardetia litoralis DSM 6794]
MCQPSKLSNCYFLFLLFLLFFSYIHQTKAQKLIWGGGYVSEDVFNTATNTGSYNKITTFVMDDADNIYTAGNFIQRVDFDITSSNYWVNPNTTFQNVFINKTDKNGNLIWSKNLRSTHVNARVRITSSTLDSQGNIYVLGVFNYTTDFDPSGGVALLAPNLGSTPNGGALFILKLDTNGNFVWVKPLRSTVTCNSGKIIVNSQDQIYVTGEFIGDIDLDPSTNEVIKTSKGFMDAFLVRLDSDGNYMWSVAKGAETYQLFSGTRSVCESGDKMLDIFLDSQDNLYIILDALIYQQDFGRSTNYINLDPSDVSGAWYNIPGGGRFLLKWDANNQSLWYKYLDLYNVLALTGTIDNNGNVLIGGNYGSLSTLNPINGNIIEQNRPTFINSVYDNRNGVKEIKVDGSNAIYINYEVLDSANIDYHGYNHQVKADGKFNVIAKYDNDLNLEWSSHVFYGNTGLSHLESFYDFRVKTASFGLDAENNLYTAGYFSYLHPTKTNGQPQEGLIDFDPDPCVVKNIVQNIPATNGFKSQISYLQKIDPYFVRTHNITYQNTIFNEAIANDGSIENTILINIESDCDILAGKNGDNFLDSGRVRVTNLPDNFRASVIRLSPTQLEFKLIGNALAHMEIDNVSDLGLEFLSAAFIDNILMSNINNLKKEDLEIKYLNPELSITNVITTNCAASEATVHFTEFITFPVGNIFTVELSDRNGDFTTPIATVSGTASPLILSLPLNIPYNSANYIIRVRASSPNAISDVENNPTIVINPLPQEFLYTITPSTTINAGQSASFNLSAGNTFINYQLLNVDTNTLIGAPVAGQGYGVFSLSTGVLNVTSNFRIIAINQNTGCQREYPIRTIEVKQADVLNVRTGVMYFTIQDAVDAAQENDVIKPLAERRYDENVVITKNITLTSDFTDYKKVHIDQIKIDAANKTLKFSGNMSVLKVVEVKEGEIIVLPNVKFALLSNSSGTAMVINHSETNTIQGNVIVERFLSSSIGYHSISSPIQNAETTQLSDDMNLILNTAYNTAVEPTYTNPFPTLYEYNESSAGTSSPSGIYNGFTIGFKVPQTPNLEIMKGYQANILGSNITMDLEGTVNNGAYSIPVTNNGNIAPNGGFNLVGNPYPSPIEFGKVLDMSTNVAGAIYVEMATSQYGTNMAALVNDVFINSTPFKHISSMQGFWVYATAATGTVNMDNSVRATDYVNPFFYKIEKEQSTKQGLIKLAIEQDGKTDETAIYFENGATSDFDGNYDALKIYTINGTTPTLYSYNKEEGKDTYFSINGLNDFNEDMMLPLAMNIVKSGKHTISVKELKYFHSLSNIYLYDSLTETLHDLKENPEYEFVATANKEVKRFVLLFKVNQLFNSKDRIIAYPNPTPNNFSYSLKNDREGTYTIRVFDSIGKLILEKTQEKQGAFLEGIINLERQSTGLYLLQISDSKNTTHIRIIRE